jgi:peptide chain release factor 2
MKVVRELKFWINSYNEVKSAADELELAFDFVKDGIVTEEEVQKSYEHAIALIEDLELKNMLRREEDKLGAVLKINAGAGGTESQDWASMLFRMYQRWCESKNYKTTVTNWQDGDDAGIKTATLQVEGELAYGFLKSENGVHRLVRVSPFNAQGKQSMQLYMKMTCL